MKMAIEENENADEIKVDDVDLGSTATNDEDGWKDPAQSPIFRFEKAGDTFIGTYVQMRENVGPNKSRLYTFTDEGGTEYAIWGSDVIDSRMDLIKPGAPVKITYNGSKPSLKNPARQYHDYTVKTK
jgi:hypothetical protein